jgi:hypothetical protein
MASAAEYSIATARLSVLIVVHILWDLPASIAVTVWPDAIFEEQRGAYVPEHQDPA